MVLDSGHSQKRIKQKRLLLNGFYNPKEVVFLFLKFAVKDFLEDRQLKNISITTLDRYTRTLTSFMEFCSKEEIVNVEEVTQNTIKKFLLYCQNELHNNSTTLNSKLRVLKSWLNYLVEAEYITEKNNPTKKIRYAKEEIKIPVFKENHVNQMLAYYRKMNDRSKSFYGVRDYALILFLLGTGARVGEVSNLRWSEVDFDNKAVILFGKRRQQQSVPLVDKLIKELADWRLYAERCLGDKPEFVFPTDDNKQLSPNAVKLIFKRLQLKMNFTDVRLSAHTFRHTLAFNFLRAGGDIVSLQKLLRHQNLDMTKVYLNAWGHALSETNDKYNPLNNLKL